MKSSLLVGLAIGLAVGVVSTGHAVDLRPSGNVSTTASGTTNVIPRFTGANTIADTSPAITSDGTNTTLASGQLRLPNGTAGSPSLTLGDPTTGLFRVAADRIGITTAGVLKWVFYEAAGTFSPEGTNLYDIGFATNRVRQLFVGASGLDSTGNINLSNGLVIQVPTSGGVQTFQSGGNPTGFLRLSANASSSHTTGAASTVGVDHSFLPASGSGSYALLHLNPTINGTSSGTAYGLLLASKTNTLTGGTIKLMSLGTTTTDGFTGYTPLVDATVVSANDIRLDVFERSAGNRVISLDTANGVRVTANRIVAWSNSTTDAVTTLDVNIARVGSGIVRVYDDAGGFNRFVLGANTTSGVSLVKSGTILKFARGDGTDGGVVQWTNDAEPTCNATNRGVVVYVAGGAGVLDTFRLCRKDAADVYAYVTLF